MIVFFFSSRRRHTRYWRDWSSDVCSSDLGVGFLNAAFGVGTIVGAALTTLLVARRRLTPPLAGGAAAWGTALVAIGLFPGRILAPVFVGVAGAGRPLIDVAGRTLLQRVVQDRKSTRLNS